MRPGSPGFIGECLKAAREARELTQTALSEMLGISRQAVSQYEKGSISPHPTQLQQLTEILNLPIEFFLTRRSSAQLRGPIFYRSMSAAIKRARTRAEHRLHWLTQIVDYLSEFVEFPPCNLPTLTFPEDPLEITLEEIDSAASEVRRFWGLGEGPISNMVYLLENNGCIVVRAYLSARTLDAFSTWRVCDGRPYFVLSSDKDSAVRSRIDAAHELAHMILHRGIGSVMLRRKPEFRQIEEQAFTFAGSFLLPAESFADDFLVPTLDALEVLKSKWNVSMGAMLMRAQELKLISEGQARRLWRSYARRGYKRHEPLDDKIPPEQPVLLKDAFQMILNENLQSREQILSALPFGPCDIEELAGLPQNYLTKKPTVRILSRHRSSKVDDVESSEHTRVVPFRKPRDRS